MASEGAAATWYPLTRAFGGDLFDADFRPLFTDPTSAGYLAMAFEIAALNEGLIDPAAASLKDVEVQELFKAGKATFDVDDWAGNSAVYTGPAKSQVAADVAAARMPNINGVSRTFDLPGALGIPMNAENKQQAAVFMQWMLEPATMEAKYRRLGNLPTRLSVLKTLNAAENLQQGNVLIAQAEVVEPLFAQGTPGRYPEFSGAVVPVLSPGEGSVDGGSSGGADRRSHGAGIAAARGEWPCRSDPLGWGAHALAKTRALGWLWPCRWR